MPKGLALVIGVGVVDPARYSGDDLREPIFENDARRMADFAKSKDFRLVGPPSSGGAFISAGATRTDVEKAMERAAGELVAGDTLLFYYSGHGSKYERNRDKKRSGELVALFDGSLRDATFKSMLKKFRPDVRIVAIVDTCHGGGFGPDEEVDPLDEYERGLAAGGSRPRRHKAIKSQTAKAISEALVAELGELLERPDPGDPEAWVLMMAACQANQLADVGENNSIFTERLLRVLENPEDEFDGSYKQLFHRVRRIIRRADQSPFYWSLGPAGDVFGHQKAFSI